MRKPTHTTSASFAPVSETAEERDAKTIEEAISFTAAIRVGGASQTIHDLPTMVEAGATAILLERRLQTGKQAIVYAVTSRGRSAMIRRPVWVRAVNEAVAALA